MNRVHILSPDIVSKIAAGEVIERPASVIKELVENSIDAGAKDIELHLKNAGKTLIHIKDNGGGIDRDDIEKIFHRHSTSKIGSLDDLYAIGSLGFRGEALYSIAAISDIILRSKTEGSETGWEVHLRDGKVLDSRPVNMPTGTEIEVKELFFNTPARKKFLKSDSGEFTQVLNTVLPYTMLHPEIRFLLKHGNRTSIDLMPGENVISRITESLNLGAENIIESHRGYPDEGLSIRLFLGDINIQRPRRDMQYVFVNGRPVVNRFVNVRMNRVYRLIMPPDVNPFFAVFITMPPENVDVNMHPAKREVKMRNEYGIVSHLESLCEGALMAYGQAKQVKMQSPFQMDGPSFGTSYEPPASPQGASESQFILFGEESGPRPEGAVTLQRDGLRNKLASARYIGSFINKYLIFESQSALLLIDQHAAQERATYERFKKQIENGKIEVQGLLAPVVIRTSPQELLAWEELKDGLEGIGLSTTQWDKENIAIHSQPQLIKDPEIAVRNILSGEKMELCDKETLARRACRSSLMTGYAMKPAEAEELRNRMLACDDPFTCPHGRPTVIEIPEKLLNSQFLRT